MKNIFSRYANLGKSTEGNWIDNHVDKIYTTKVGKVYYVLEFKGDGRYVLNDLIFLQAQTLDSAKELALKRNLRET